MPAMQEVMPTTPPPLALDPEQQRAVDHDGSPCIVLAGPGSGKTRIIIARIARLLREGAQPESILALTFTVKAAEEVRARLEDQLGSPGIASRVRCQTFHSFGHDLLRRFHDLLSLPGGWRILDSAERRRLLRAIVTEHNLFADRTAAGRDGLLPRLASFIEACRQAAKTPADAIVYAEQWLARAERAQTSATGEDARIAAAADLQRARMFASSARVFEHFEAACLQQGCLTFDDFMVQPIRLLREHAAPAAIVQAETRHVLVDEFQDVNAAQIEMLRLIAPPRAGSNGPDLMIVGDDDQAIYGFRGAEPKAFERFESIWTNAKTIELSTNYRSPGEVVDVASAIIGRASSRFRPQKSLRASNAWHAEPPGGPPSVEPMEISENGLTGALIASLIRADRAETDRPWSHYAVIVRNNTPADVLAEELRLHSIPVHRRRLSTPADDPSVRDLFAWMNVLAGSDQVAHVQRLLLRAPMLVAAETVAQWMQRFRAARHASGAARSSARSFVAWLREHVGDRKDIARLLKRYDRLRRRTAGKDAARAAYDILRVTGLLRHPRRIPHETDIAIFNMAHVMSFIEDRLPALEPPCDLAAFVHHYEDMDEVERDFEAPHLDQLDTNAEAGDGEGVDAVTVVTAHKAKGLEFDTVFLPQVRKGGFPYTRRGGKDDALHDDFLNRPEADQHDEERRVFYVACTRAQRRLVLIGKKQVQKKQDDFLGEIKQSGRRPIDGDAFLAAHAAPAPAYLQPKAPEPGPGAALELEADRAWEAAVRALHAAAWGVEHASELTELQDQLAMAAASLASFAHAREHHAAPDALPIPAETRSRIDAILKGHVPRQIFEAPKPPLNLSFSDISAYLQCPRCYAVSRLLHFAEPSTAALALGNCVHGALEKFAKQRAEAESEGLFMPGRDALLALGREQLLRWPAHLPLTDATAAHVDAQIAHAFELIAQGGDDLLEVEHRIKFAYTPADGGSSHNFVAKIDRIDRLADGGFRIVDYKTGKAKDTLINPPADDLQMCIYAMALTVFGQTPDPATGALPIPTCEDLPRGVAEYWLLSEGRRGVISFAELDLARARENIDYAITGILAGRFPRRMETDAKKEKPMRHQYACKPTSLCAILPKWL